MNNFKIRELKCADIKSELESVGFDKSYINRAVDKFRYKNIKILDLSLPQANILKQTAISVGADCALHREVITAKVEKTDCILGGSFSQLKKIAQKLRLQPFKMGELAGLIEKGLDFSLEPMTIKGRVFDFKKPYIVGVINLTTDSFSDGGEFYEFEKSKSRLLELIEEGADIIELGAESTKPFSPPVGAEIQLEKLLPMLDFVKGQGIKTPISIDTRSSFVAKKCVEAGADIINDVSGLDFDPLMVQTLAELDVPVIIQHSKGTPEDMQTCPVYENLMDEIFFELKNKVNKALEAGIKPQKIIVDPGIGFGKTTEHNFEILRRAQELLSLGCPVMIGLSRKSLLNMNEEPNEVKDIYTLALNALLIEKKVSFIRVHNVKLHRKLMDLLK